MQSTLSRISDSITTAVLNVAIDVSKDHIHILPALPGWTRGVAVSCQTDVLLETFKGLKKEATERGFSGVRVICEPTGVYHEMPMAAAHRCGCELAFVDASKVAKAREIELGDRSKTDGRDPVGILGLAEREILQTYRQFDEVFEGLRQAGARYDRLDRERTRLKNRIRRLLRQVFPDFDFSRDFLYSASGQAIFDAFAFCPHRIAGLSLSKVDRRLRRRAPRIRRSSVDRLHKAARRSMAVAPTGVVQDVLIEELSDTWNDLQRALMRLEKTKKRIEDLYRRARLIDPKLPAPTRGVITAVGLGRLVGEIGPPSDFDSVGALYRYVGFNLIENSSGHHRGHVRISKGGRSRARVVLDQIVLPLVRKGQLYGDWYHHKRQVEKMPGNKAMAAAARKFLNTFWGWYRSGRDFDFDRVFTCESAYRKAA